MKSRWLMTGAWVRRAVVLGALCVSFWATPARAQTLAIDGNYRFNSDVTCTANPCVSIGGGGGTRVDGRGFVVDCNGHSIGVLINATDITVVSLTVRNCAYSFWVTPAASGATLRRNRSENAINIGFRLFGDNALLNQNVSTTNLASSANFVVEADGAVLRDNAASGGYLGIQLNPSSSGALVIGNSAENASLYGVLVEQGSTLNNLLRNRASGNTQYDLVDLNTDCDSNVWSHNQFTTAYPSSCIQ